MTDSDVILPNATPVLVDFVAVDLFNDNNTIEGRIHKESTQMYGALEIDTVNGQPAPQVIWCTPKLRYPFHGEDKRITEICEHDRILIYNKLDGTNIFGYTYHDASGREFVSYKTRLVPTLQAQHRFGDFNSMWREMLARYPQIPDLVRKYRGVSFEMYGRRNPIIMQYESPLLDAVILFAVPKPGRILAPSGMDTAGVPVPELVASLDAKDVDAFAAEYWRIRDWLNTKLTVTERPGKTSEGEDITVKAYSGMEGAVWYLVDKGDTIIGGVPLKAKPDEIFDLCQRGTVPLHSIKITIINAIEQGEPLTYELVKRLLLEEFPEDRINAREPTIRREIERKAADMRLLDELAPEYIKNGFDIDADKATTMRYFGARYDKKLATRIYGLLLRHFSKVGAD